MALSLQPVFNFGRGKCWENEGGGLQKIRRTKAKQVMRLFRGGYGEYVTAPRARRLDLEEMMG